MPWPLADAAFLATTGLVTVAAVSIAAVAGFVAGWFLGKRDPSRKVLERAERAKDVLDEVVARMESARADCDRLTSGGELGAGAVGSPGRADAERLETSHARLGGAVAAVVDGVRSATARVAAAWTGWERGGTDAATGLPDAAAVARNVARLAAAGEGGVLLISVDGRDRLIGVRGAEVAAKLCADLFRVAVRAGRDDDFVGALDAGTAALLFRDFGDDGLGPAVAVRDAVKRHKFFAGDPSNPDAPGPEVLVTASFGVTPVWPSDTADSAIARARDAADRSRRGGRNRLHGHDGIKIFGPA